jgi:nitrogen fixation/metabolism regulation signal transduction histidine kinase
MNNGNMVVGKIEFGRTPKAPEEFISVDYVINDAVAAKMYNALMVVALDSNINAFLTQKDPKALQQCLDAIEEYKTSYQESNIDNL